MQDVTTDSDLDFGSQYTQLIARRVRELNVYCEIHPYNKVPAITPNIKGVILSGSPCSVRDKGAPNVDIKPFEKVPCLGSVMEPSLLRINTAETCCLRIPREYGRARLTTVDHHNELLKEISLDTQVWMSHADTIAKIPDDFEVIASTPSVPIAAYKLKDKAVYGIQFHPEVTHTVEGKNLLRNFVVHICECAQDWTPDQFVETTITEFRKLGDDQVSWRCQEE